MCVHHIYRKLSEISYVLYKYSLKVAIYPKMQWISASSAAATHPIVDVVLMISKIKAEYGFIHG